MDTTFARVLNGEVTEFESLDLDRARLQLQQLRARIEATGVTIPEVSDKSGNIVSTTRREFPGDPGGAAGWVVDAMGELQDAAALLETGRPTSYQVKSTASRLRHAEELLASLVSYDARREQIRKRPWNAFDGFNRGDQWGCPVIGMHEFAAAEE